MPQNPFEEFMRQQAQPVNEFDSFIQKEAKPRPVKPTQPKTVQSPRPSRPYKPQGPFGINPLESMVDTMLAPKTPAKPSPLKDGMTVKVERPQTGPITQGTTVRLDQPTGINPQIINPKYRTAAEQRAVTAHETEQGKQAFQQNLAERQRDIAAERAAIPGSIGGKIGGALAGEQGSQKIGQFINRFARGAGSGTGQILTGIGAMSSPIAYEAAMKDVKPFNDWMQRTFPTDQGKTDFLNAVLPEGAGSVLPFLAGTALTRGGPMAAAMLGAAMNAGQTYEEAINSGSTPEDAVNAARIGAVIGTAESLGLGRTLDKFGVKQAFSKRALNVLEEKGQEGLSQWLGNVNAKLLSGYDPDRALGEGVAEAAAVGGLIGGGMQAASIPFERRAQRQADIQAVAAEQPAPLNLTPSRPGGTRTSVIPLNPTPEQAAQLERASGAIQQSAARDAAEAKIDEILALPVEEQRAAFEALPEDPLFDDVLINRARQEVADIQADPSLTPVQKAQQVANLRDTLAAEGIDLLPNVPAQGTPIQDRLQAGRPGGPVEAAPTDLTPEQRTAEVLNRQLGDEYIQKNEAEWQVEQAKAQLARQREAQRQQSIAQAEALNRQLAKETEVERVTRENEQAFNAGFAEALEYEKQARDLSAMADWNNALVALAEQKGTLTALWSNLPREMKTPARKRQIDGELERIRQNRTELLRAQRNPRARQEGSLAPQFLTGEQQGAAPTETGEASPDLLQTVRRLGGIKTEGATYGGEIAGILRPKESGTTGIVNNKSGMDLDYMREALVGEGAIPPETTNSELLEMLDMAVRNKDRERPTGTIDEQLAAYLDEQGRQAAEGGINPFEEFMQSETEAEANAADADWAARNAEATQASEDRRPPMGLGPERSNPARSDVSYSPYNDLVTNNRELVDQLFNMPLDEGANDRLEEGLAKIQEWADRRGIEQRHVDALEAYIRSHHLQRARAREDYQSDNEYLDWLQNEAEAELARFKEEEIAAFRERFNALLQDETAITLFNRGRTGGDFEEFGAYANEKHGLNKRAITEAAREYAEKESLAATELGSTAGSVSEGTAEDRYQRAVKQAAQEELDTPVTETGVMGPGGRRDASYQSNKTASYRKRMYSTLGGSTFYPDEVDIEIDGETVTVKGEDVMKELGYKRPATTPGGMKNRSYYPDKETEAYAPAKSQEEYEAERDALIKKFNERSLAEAKAKSSATITAIPGGRYTIKTGRFNSLFVQELKRSIPARGRSWNPDLRVWEVDGQYIDKAREITRKYYGYVGDAKTEAAEREAAPLVKPQPKAAEEEPFPQPQKPFNMPMPEPELPGRGAKTPQSATKTPPQPKPAEKPAPAVESPFESPLKSVGEFGVIGQSTHTKPSELTKELNAEVRLVKAQEPAESDARAARAIPTFQGGKTKMARAATRYIRSFFGQDAGKITEIDDWFAGSGSWGAYLATTVFRNVKTIRIHEFNPQRAAKVRLFHERGDQIAALVKHPVIARVLTSVEKILDNKKTYSGSALARAVEDEAAKLRQIKQPDTIIEGVLQAIVDHGSASFGVQEASSGRAAIDRTLAQVSANAKEAHAQIAQLRARGVKFEYVVGDSYADAAVSGPNVLSIVDPPYYGTKGYNGVDMVSVGTYEQTRDLLARAKAAQNSIIYTDEAWWEKHEKDSGKTTLPADAPENLFGQSGRGMLTSIRGEMDEFFRIPIAERIETVGLYNGTRTRAVRQPDAPARTSEARGTQGIDRSGTRPDGGKADRGMAGEGAQSRRGVPADGEVRAEDVEDRKPSLKMRAPAAPAFYSALERFVADKKFPNKASGVQMLGMIMKPQSGVKPDEVKWLGLEDWLRSKDNVTKDEVLDFIRANNMKVEEVVKGGPLSGDGGTGLNDAAIADDLKTLEDDGVFIEQNPDNPSMFGFRDPDGDTIYDADDIARFAKDGEYSQSTVDAARRVEEYLNSGRPVAAPTKFSQYTLKGAKDRSYRELLLTMPKEGQMPYRSSHWDEDNILAHIRFNERTDADGKRVLFVEEIQSDWAQEGRKKGYRKVWTKAEVDKFTVDPVDEQVFHAMQDGDKWKVLGPDGNVVTRSDSRAEAEEAAENMNYGYRGISTGGDYVVRDGDGNIIATPPKQFNKSPEAALRLIKKSALDGTLGALDGVAPMPFPKTDSWAMLAFKRVLRHAAENGYDRVAWTTGEQQAERYDLSKQIKSLSYNRLNRDTADEQVSIIATGLDGERVIQKVVKPEELEDVVGKELATKILEDPKGRGELTGLDLKAGGEGMKGFYDAILPSAVNKYLKKWGVKAGETKTVTGERQFSKYPTVSSNGTDYWLSVNGERVSRNYASALDAMNAAEEGMKGAVTVHSVDITDAMRESVMQGQPLFFREGKRADRTVTTRSGRKVSAKTPEFLTKGEIPPDAQGKNYDKVYENIGGEFAQKRREGVPGTLYLNDHATWVLDEVELSMMEGMPGYENLKPHAYGGATVLLNDAQQMADILRDRAENLWADRPDIQENINGLADLIEEAIADARANGKQNSIEIVNASKDYSEILPEEYKSYLDSQKKTRRHESAHIWQTKIDPNRPGLLANSETADDVYYEKIRDALYNYYPNITHDQVYSEAFAFIASGDWARAGLTKKEAAKWLNYYFTKIAKKYGRAALAAGPKRMHPMTKGILTDVRRQTEQTRRDQGANGRSVETAPRESLKIRGLENRMGRRQDAGGAGSRDTGSAGQNRGGEGRGVKPKTAAEIFQQVKDRTEKTATPEQKSESAARRAVYEAAKLDKEGKLTPERRAEAIKYADELLAAGKVNDEARIKAAKKELQNATREAADLPEQTKLDKLSAAWKAGLLTGPATHIVNILSNAGFQVTEEVSRIPASMFDLLASVGTKRRTVAGPNLKVIGSAAAKAATEGLKHANEIMKNGVPADVMENMNYPEVKFKFKSAKVNSILNNYVNGVFRLLSAEDQVYKTFALARSMEAQAKLIAEAEVRRGEIPKSQLAARRKYLYENPTAEMSLRAVEDSLVATFQNDNTLSNAIKSGRRQLSPGGRFTLDMFLPFDRTPTNIIARTLEMTLLGYVVGAKQIASALSKEGFTEAKQRRFAQTFGRASVGTVLMALGWKLGAMGLLTGFYDDDRNKEKLNQAVGRQPNALNLGGRSFFLGGMGPLGVLLGLGATLQREANQKIKNEDDRPFKMLRASSEIILNLPMMQGSRRAKEMVENPAGLGAKAGQMVGSFVPTAISSIADLLDPFERDTKSFLGGIGSRIPGTRNLLPEKKDALGETIPNNWSGFPKAALNLVDFTRSRSIKDMPVTNEMLRLDLGLNKMEDPQEFVRAGNSLVDSPIYKAADDTMKGRMIMSLQRRLSDGAGKTDPADIKKGLIDADERAARKALAPQAIKTWTEVYGEALRKHPRFNTLSAQAQKAALDILKDRAEEESRRKVPRLKRFNAAAIIKQAQGASY